MYLFLKAKGRTGLQKARPMIISSSGSHSISAFRNGPCVINKVYKGAR